MQPFRERLAYTAWRTLSIVGGLIVLVAVGRTAIAAQVPGSFFIHSVGAVLCGLSMVLLVLTEPFRDDLHRRWRGRGVPSTQVLRLFGLGLLMIGAFLVIEEWRHPVKQLLRML